MKNSNFIFKLYYIPLFLILCASPFAYARINSVPEPYITKHNSSGHTAAAWVRGESCMVYQNKVIIIKYYGYDNDGNLLSTSQELPFQINGKIDALIEAASKEPTTTVPNGLCDGPATSVTARYGNSADFIIYSTGGCGTPSEIKNGPISSALEEIVSQFCPTTHRNHTVNPQ